MISFVSIQRFRYLLHPFRGAAENWTHPGPFAHNMGFGTGC
jgi:hypothetical protein